MPKTAERPKETALYKAILELKDEDECRRFFQDLCSMTELSAMEQRFEVARLLYQGRVYTEILGQTGASSATISRVNRALNYSADGLRDLFVRMFPTSGEK